MKPLHFFFLLISVFYFNPLKTKAQELRIVKDNIACAYGIKNDKGEWVAQPVYTSITMSKHGYFFVKDGNLQGILNLKAETVIPCKYNSISFPGTPDISMVYRYDQMKDTYNRYTQFMVAAGDKKGIINNKGKIVHPVQYSFIKVDRYGKYFLYRQEIRNQYAHIYTTIGDTAGNILFKEKKGYVMAFDNSGIMAIGGYAHYDHTISGKAGLIDMNGNLLCDTIYNQLSSCADGTYAIELDGKTGMIDAKGNVLVKPEYRILYSGYGTPTMACLCEKNIKKIYRIYDDKKVGLMRGNGTVILKPEYDNIEETPHYHKTSWYHWLIFQGKNKGILNDKYETVFPAEYQLIQPCQTYHNNNHNSGVKHMHVFLKKNNKWGFYADNGKELEPCVHDTFFRFDYMGYKRNDIRIFYLIKDNNTVAYNVMEYPAKKLELKPISKYKNAELFSDGSLILPVLRGENGEQINENFDYRESGNLFFIQQRHRVLVYNRNSKKWFTARVADHQRGIYIEILTKTGKAGLINSKTGAWVTDTIYTEFEQNYRSNKFIWAKTSYVAPKNGTVIIGTSNQNLWQTTNKISCPKSTPLWVLLDTTGKIVCKEKFDYHGPITDTLSLLKSNGRMGLFNTMLLKWDIPPQFNKLETKGGKLYMATSCGGKFGLYHETGKKLCDTVYTEAQLVFTDMHQGNKQASAVWLMSRPEGKTLFGGGSHEFTESRPAKIESLLMDYVLHDEAGKYNLANFKPLFSLKDSLKPMLRQSPFRGQIFQKLMLFPSSSNETRYQLSHITANTCVIVQETFIPQHSMEMPMSPKVILQIHNFQYENNLLTELNPSALFDSRENFKNELLASIQNNEKLNLDCSGIDNLADQGINMMELSPEGLKVFLNNESQWYNHYQVTIIPWERVALQRGGAAIAKLYLKK